MGVKVSVPSRPGAISADPRLVRSRKAKQGGDGAFCGCGDIGLYIEIVAVRFRVEQDCEPVRLAQAGISVHEQATVLNLHFRGKVDALRLVTGDAGRQHEIVDLELVDGNVEARQDRAFLFAREEFRQAHQGRTPRHKAVDVEPVVEPASRVPVDLGTRDREEYALRIGQAHIVENRFAVDIPVNPADGNIEPVREGLACNPVGEETLADGSVQDDQRPGDQEQGRAKKAEHPLTRAPKPRTAFLRANLGLGFHVRHQNAWPRETYTATGASSGSGLRGTPTSRRRGPKPDS